LHIIVKDPPYGSLGYVFFSKESQPMDRALFAGCFKEDRHAINLKTIGTGEARDRFI